MLKMCTKCNENKDLSEFSKCKRNKDGHQYRCKSCDSKVDKNWYTVNAKRKKELSDRWQKENPDKVKKYKLQKYGLTVKEHDLMLANQNNLCALCLKPETDVVPQTGEIKALTVDHCHVTGRVRGLLCGNCNRALGHFKDDPNVCDAASIYLRRFLS